ncbi:MAG: ATP-binding cassette domain-containing protein [Capnocytophaga sp.]|nr:ATP-binding cassette domain-containing protein [Capnocytophaga sp.]
MLIINIQEKKYSSEIILKNIAETISGNGLYGVVGRNGSGKTTFFNCISRLTDFQGNIVFDGKEMTPRQTAFCPTEPFLYEHLTVGEFYRFYENLIGVKPAKQHFFDVKETLLTSELSTGMRKKAYLNALLQKKYDIYIFDEPFNGLDIESAYQVKTKIRQLAENHIVFVSSHVLETLSDCRCIFLIENNSLEKFSLSEIRKIEERLFGEKSI